MLVYGVEGEKSAATMVKDSKTYIEIAKFVEAYTTIIQNPNEFLAEVGEPSINPDTDLLSWNQLVKILTTCDLGFDPVPTEKQLVSYYSYARQIGSISKEVKQLATVSDVAEAQKHYYNFVDEETEKMTTLYNKQHEIAANRAKEVEIIGNNLKNIKTKKFMFLTGMMVSVFFVLLGVAEIIFDLFSLEDHSISARYIVGSLFIIVGIAGFYVFDKLYIKSKRNYYDYHKETRETVSRSEKTSLDEKVLRDKLAKYENDLKIAKYELADKEKRFDVEKNIEVLRERNRYYRMLRDRDMGRDFNGFGRRKRMSLIRELEESNSESLFSIFGGDDAKKAKKRAGKSEFKDALEDLLGLGSNVDVDVKGKGKKDTASRFQPSEGAKQPAINHFLRQQLGDPRLHMAPRDHVSALMMGGKVNGAPMPSRRGKTPEIRRHREDVFKREASLLDSAPTISDMREYLKVVEKTRDHLNNDGMNSLKASFLAPIPDFALNKDQETRRQQETQAQTAQQSKGNSDMQAQQQIQRDLEKFIANYERQQ